MDRDQENSLSELLDRIDLPPPVEPKKEEDGAVTLAKRYISFFGDAYQQGNPLAALSTIALCDKHGLPPPPWVIEHFAKASRVFLSGGDNRAFTGQAGSVGRHSDPRTKGKQQQKDEWVRAALLVAEHEGWKGEKKSDVAYQILESIGIKQCSVETVGRIAKQSSTVQRDGITKLLFNHCVISAHYALWDLDPMDLPPKK